MIKPFKNYHHYSTPKNIQQLQNHPAIQTMTFICVNIIVT